MKPLAHVLTSLTHFIILLSLGCVAHAAAPLKYDPSTQSLSLRPGQSSTFVLGVSTVKDTVTATLPTVSPNGATGIPAAWVSASPTQAAFAKSGKDFTISVTVPASATAGTYSSTIRAHVIQGSYGDGQGCTVNLTVRSNAAPTASFGYSPDAPTDLETVSFTDASSDSDGSVGSWAWDFGDGATATVRNPGHRYAAPGSYSASLTVTDDCGATATTTKTVVVGNVAPTAGFAFSPTSPTTADAVAFTDSSADPDGIIASWSWTFGDGATSTTSSPVHRYLASGVYTVSLTVTDNWGSANTSVRTIAVANVPPAAAFTFTPTSPTTADIVAFTDGSTDSDGTVVARAWDFGDGSASRERSPSHHYASCGIFMVTLTVTDDGGLTDVRQTAITVKAPCAVASAPPVVPELTYGGSHVVNSDAMVRLDVAVVTDTGAAEDPTVPDALVFDVLDVQNRVAAEVLASRSADGTASADVTLTPGVYRVFAAFGGTQQLGMSVAASQLVVASPGGAGVSSIWGALNDGAQQCGLLCTPDADGAHAVNEFAYVDHSSATEVTGGSLSATWQNHALVVTGKCRVDGISGHDLRVVMTPTQGAWRLLLQIDSRTIAEGALSG